MYLFRLLFGWLMTFWFFETMPAQWPLGSWTHDCCLLCFGGTAVRGLAQSFLKSILALWARDNLENIIQNSTFQHVSSIKGVFLSRVSTKTTWPKNARIRLKKKQTKIYILFKPSIIRHMYREESVCACTCTWACVHTHTIYVYSLHIDLSLDSLNKWFLLTT